MKRPALLLLASALVTACGSSGTSVTHENSAGSTSSSNTASAALPKDARASVYLKGNASPHLPGGKPGVVDVIVVGTVTEADPSATGASVPIVVRNNTSHPVHGVAAAITARDSSGALVASGSDQGFQPDVVQPGEVAIGFGYFQIGSKVSARDKFEVQITSQDGADTEPMSRVDLAVKEVNLSGDNIVGTLSNTSGGTVSGPIQVNAVCFSGNGPLFTQGAFANPDTVQPSGTASFQISLYGKACPVFLVGGSGYRQ